MSTLVIVVADTPPEGASSDSRRREALRITLDRLWSEPAGVPFEVVVHADGELAEIARREHRRRVRVIERDGRSWPRCVNDTLDGRRADVFAFVALGSAVTPAWLRELRAAALEDTDAPTVVGPCLPQWCAATEQAAVAPQDPDRPDLRRAATVLRFHTPRFSPVEALAPLCLGLSRAALDRAGGLDDRYVSVGGALVDLQRRIAAAGGPLLLAHRVLVGQPTRPVTGIPGADRDALEGRRTFLAALPDARVRVALELEDDDPDHALLGALADGLRLRGIDLATFSRRLRPTGRPSRAPHVHSVQPHQALGRMQLALVRGSLELGVPALRVAEGGTVDPRAAVATPAALDQVALDIVAFARGTKEGRR